MVVGGMVGWQTGRGMGELEAGAAATQAVVAVD